ncbi:MAG TPA: hypothetical protein ENN24_00850, partial [Bacteroidetes bacterium]|nr:hypothetical protein [Bacteroidota bacterium]
MFRSAILLSLMLMCANTVVAQKHSRTLNWPAEPSVRYTMSDEQGNHVKPHLRFNGNLEFPLAPVMIPFYSETVPVSASVTRTEDVVVELSNVQFERLSASESALLSKVEVDSISKLSVEHNVFTSRNNRFLQISV